jgi:hypothetical protein
VDEHLLLCDKIIYCLHPSTSSCMEMTNSTRVGKRCSACNVGFLDLKIQHK